MSFATYATGFVEIDQLDTSGLPGDISLRVGDGVMQVNAPETTMQDDLILSYNYVSVDKPIDSLSIRMLYQNADGLDGVAIPSGLSSSDFESITLTFSNRIDAISSGNRQVSKPTPAPSQIIFNVLRLETLR